MEKLRHASESDAARQDGQRSASPFEDETTRPTPANPGDGGERYLSDRRVPVVVL